MPLIRCPKCSQAYDVPGVVAVRLPNSIATCHCGEWIAGNKAALLARMLDPAQINQVDLQGYRVDEQGSSPFEEISDEAEVLSESDIISRSVRIVARGLDESLNEVFTIGEHPLWIGRKGSHVELEGAELDLRHCSISLLKGQLVVRDAESHMGTFLDGRRISEAALSEGVHLLRVGSALVSIEPTAESGIAVEPMALDDSAVFDDSVLRVLERRDDGDQAGRRSILVCVDGPLLGQEFEIPASGLIVGREGHVRVPDEFLSRKHFEVTSDADGTVRVRDLGSRNGTFLNTLPARNTKVQRGDEIRAGVNRFRIERRA
ncbi:MAG TPA: FHA domain-containing protein [Thermoanaerobaculia bacterium]|nr:FHA domain-containing protein [Thermoanaerobaculia bacterium]